MIDSTFPIESGRDPDRFVMAVGVAEEIVDMKAEKGAWDRSVSRWSR